MAETYLPPSIKRVVHRYVRVFAPARIVLFGSYAKGAQRPNSDVDLLMVTNFGADSSEIQRQARQLARDCFPPVDVVLASTSEVEQATMTVNPFLASILATGITVYPWSKMGLIGS